MRKLYVCTESPDKSDVNETQRGYGLWQGVRIQIAHSDDTTMDATNTVALMMNLVSSLFKAVGVEIELDKIMEWLNSDANDKRVQIYTDSDICELVSHSEDNIEYTDGEPSDEEIHVISDGDAARFFGLCLTWLEATVYNTSVVRSLHSCRPYKKWMRGR